jgi:hypothetical protein
MSLYSGWASAPQPPAFVWHYPREEPNGRQLARLLRARRERQYGDRAAKQRDELASFPNRPPNLPERE